MNKNQAWHSIASSIAAGVSTYFLLDFAENDWSQPWRVAIIIVVAILAFFVAFLTGRNNQEKDLNSPDTTEVGRYIDSGSSVEIEDVSVKKSTANNIKVGTDISAKKDVKIKGIEIDTDKEE
ncbi:hypothetical protein SAMN05660860_00269 [Geoalkalibacter ferrihydriticus]|uniref:Uncharacterized protein n=2 Tax=Geoalkalibacter ferrihydriticus TaxID=392333 RepID=A0A0C2HF79_9BACT|nr:MerC domain-containing protein [Geoalkalibacter ferrihydriticus]KIH75601.1 hypothetical protein GFER_15795 [Geoalkalibacter ferrihydriticus DSM 17813]SDL29785.1 hypothetical protein SAMN05660860_00269 [Geoalkalibacter ferrihydriticus]